MIDFNNSYLLELPLKNGKKAIEKRSTHIRSCGKFFIKRNQRGRAVEGALT